LTLKQLTKEQITCDELEGTWNISQEHIGATLEFKRGKNGFKGKSISNLHSYDILGAGMLWKPKEARILTNFNECRMFWQGALHVNSQILKCKMTNVITLLISLCQIRKICFS
jgi:hypothetical protein